MVYESAGARDGATGEHGGQHDDGAIKVFTVLWREPQARKNKSWDDDGVCPPSLARSCSSLTQLTSYPSFFQQYLLLKDLHATLRSDSGKLISTGNLAAVPDEDDEVKVGGKDVKPAIIQDAGGRRRKPWDPSPRKALGSDLGSGQITKVNQQSSEDEALEDEGGKEDELEDDSGMEVDDEDESERTPRKASAGMEKSSPVVEEEKGEEDEEEEVSRYYLCQYRKHSTKKQPVWEGDGILIVTGRKALLKDRETEKDVLISHIKAQEGGFTKDSEVTIGSKMIAQIEEEISEEDYFEGRLYIAGGVPVVKPETFFIPGLASAALKKPIGFRAPAVFRPLADKLAVSAPAPKPPPPMLNASAPGAVVMRRPDAQHEVRFNKKQARVVDVVLDPIIAEQLRPHQVEGIKFMYECVMGMRSEHQGCILADDMGLGKTIQAIALLYTLLKQNPYGGVGGVIDRVVIACPVSLIKNWAAEIKKWLGKDRLAVFVADGSANIKSFAVSRTYKVLIIGYEKLRTVIDDVRYAQPPIGLVICDEGHRLKSAAAKVTQALKQLSAPRRIILSGTPVQNNLSELHAMVDFVNPGALREYPAFKKYYEKPILTSRDPKASAKDRKLGETRSKELTEEVDMYLIRRESDIIKKFLPPKFEFTVFIVPTALEIKLYKAILEGTAVAEVLSGTRSQQLSLLMVLRKLSTSPGLLMKQASEGVGSDILTAEVKSLFPEGVKHTSFSLSGKLMALGSLLKTLHEQSTSEKIVVVSNFTSTLNLVEAHCNANKYPCRRLDGTTPAADRLPMVNDFNKGPRKSNFVFLLSSKSGGTGLNIIGASRLVLLDGDWNPSNDMQAMARIHRQGQTKHCFIYRFLTAGTMDEKIFQRQVTKMGLSRSVMKTADTGKSGKGEDAFTNDDLRNIFRVHTGVTSQTHDLLECRCHLGEEPVDDASESEDEVDLPTASQAFAGFLQASQWQAENPDEAAKQRKNLIALKEEYAHYDCRNPSVIDKIQDDVLRAVIYDRQAAAVHEGGNLDNASGEQLKGSEIGFAFRAIGKATEVEDKGSGSGSEEEED
ncbi:DNA repair and recombination protein RAD54B [Pseudohyphozyma bogoriensis]|nr:DNA repair and recombination protein RAD54B [Pseudohyphozyma bogoriensis]